MKQTKFHGKESHSSFSSFYFYNNRFLIKSKQPQKAYTHPTLLTCYAAVPRQWFSVREKLLLIIPEMRWRSKKKLLSKPWFLFGSNHSPLKWRLTWMSSISFHSWSFSWLKYQGWSTAWRGGGGVSQHSLTPQMFTQSLTKLHFLSPSAAGVKVFCLPSTLRHDRDDARWSYKHNRIPAIYITQRG